MESRSCAAGYVSMQDVDSNTSSLAFSIAANDQWAYPLLLKLARRHDYYESVTQQIPSSKEWVPVTFNLQTEDKFKCAKDNYRSYTHNIQT